MAAFRPPHQQRQAILALADGSVFSGFSPSQPGSTLGEVIFNTSLTGYQEILTDPSYCSQFIVFSNPHIGNVGVNPEDEESSKIWAAGLIVRELATVPSNWRSTQTLHEYCQQQSTPILTQIDTRQLTRHIRQHGAQKACLLVGQASTLTTENINNAIEQAKQWHGIQGLSLTQTVSINRKNKWFNGEPQTTDTPLSDQQHIIAIDYGIKHNILRLLAGLGGKITVVPAHTTYRQIIELKPDGIFLSNGPGDPAACKHEIATIQQLFNHPQLPIMGICLGTQLLALASGAQTEKMLFGHHGANHPVIDLQTKKVIITSQNHGFAIADNSLPPQYEVSHRSLFDNSIQGIRHTVNPWFGLQGHPEASPGPHDWQYCFNQFSQAILQTSNQNQSSYATKN